MRLRTTLLRILAVLLTFLAAGELALRASGFVYPSAAERAIVWSPERDPELRDPRGWIGFDAHELWRTRPLAALPFAPGERLDENGLRGPALAREPREGTLRVALLGSEAVFGLGLPWRDTLASELADALRARGIEAEVLCAAVPGTTVRQGLERWRDLVREFRPEVVVSAYGGEYEHLQAPRSLSDDARIDESCRGRWRPRGWPRPRPRAGHEACGGASAGDAALAAPRGAPEEVEEPLHERVRAGSRLAHAVAWLADIQDGVYWRERFQELQELRVGGGSGGFDVQGVRRVSYAEFVNFLVTLNREVRAEGAELVLLALPHRDPAATKSSPMLGLYANVLVEAAVAERLPLVDGSLAFLEAERAGIPREELFLAGDLPSQCGQLQLANAIAGAIADRAAARGADDPPR